MSNDLETLFSLNNKHFIVSGGAGLLGPVFAKGILLAGGTVSLVDLNGEKLSHRGAALLQQFPDKVSWHRCDITAEAEAGKIVDDIAGKHRNLYGLVNAAAVDPKFEANSDQVHGDFLSYETEALKQSLEVNLVGLFIFSKLVGRFLSSKGEGSIVNISSTYGLVGPDQNLYKEGIPDHRSFKPVDYTITKSAILGYTKYLASYFRNTRIRVNTLAPGGIQNDHSQNFIDAYSRRTLLGRMGLKEEMMGPMIFLLSESSSYMTGSTLIVDGGWTAI